jgi:hypothetical protein
LGALIGLALYLAAFFIYDGINSPTSFFNTTLEPSRVFWNLSPEDFQSPLKRFGMIVNSAQWGNALFPGGDFSSWNELFTFIDRLFRIEFSPLVVLLALAGLVIMVIRFPMRGAFFPLTFLVSLFYVLNYQVSDKNVFYLSLYIPLMVAAGTGMGFALEKIQRYLEPLSGRSAQALYLLGVLFLGTVVVQPTAAIRWQALQAGAADFVTEEYPYPVKNLSEPRFVAQMRLAGVADNAVFVLDWRWLFSTAYLAHVEKDLTNILFLEAMPYGSDGQVASTLINQLKGYMEDGRPVYTDQKYPGLEENFRLLPAQGDLYQLKLRK